HKFGLAKTVLFQRIYRIRVQHAHDRAIGSGKTNLRWRLVGAPCVDKEIPLWTDGRGMVAGCRGQPLKIAAVKLDAIEIVGNMAVASSRKVQPAACLVHVVENSSLPVAAGDLSDELPVSVKMIQMLPTGAFAGNKEGAVAQKFCLARIVDKGLRCFAEEAPG